MNCEKCGAPLNDSDVFCPRCGQKAAGDTAETELFRKQRTSFHPTPLVRHTGVFVLTGRRIHFTPHFFLKPFDIRLSDIKHITDAYQVFFNSYFDITTHQGKNYMFSLFYLNIGRTQAVVDLIRKQTDLTL